MPIFCTLQDFNKILTISNCTFKNNQFLYLIALMELEKFITYNDGDMNTSIINVKNLYSSE